MYIYGIVIGLLIIVIIYLFPKHKLDQEVVQKNQELKKDNDRLIAAVASAETETRALEKRKKSLNADIETISAQASAAADEIYKKSYDLMQEKMSQSAEIAGFKYQLAEDQHKKEYLALLEENTKDFVQQILEKSTELQNIQDQLTVLKNKVHTAIEVDKRRVLDEEAKDYYKIKISDDELSDIKILREVVKELKCDPLPINKVIWEVYYKNPTMALLGRLTPTGSTHIGIYKITNIDTNQCYIGQSVNKSAHEKLFPVIAGGCC